MRARTKAMTNYVVDLVIAAAFVAAAVSGIVFLLPSGWIGAGGSGQPAMLGVTMSAWRTLHEWSSLIMVAGVVLHTVLHWRWVVAMTRKTFAPPRRAQGEAGRAAAGPGAAPLAPGVVLTHYVSDARRTVFRSGTERSDEPTSLLAAEAAVSSATRDDTAPRHTRREVLVGFGVVGAAVVTGGLAGRALADQLLARTASAGDAGVSDEDVVLEGGGSDDGGEGLSSSGATSVEGSPSGASSGSSGTLTTERVVVDDGRCSGCGHCLPACPYGVFTWGGSTAVVADAGACHLCGRCLEVCPASAITLNA